MKAHDPRFLRQLLLPEIGEEGQRRILQSELCLPSDLSGAERGTALLYGLGAGLKGPAVGPAQLPEPSFLAAHFRHEEARAVARGAHLALLSLRRALGTEPPAEVAQPDSPPRAFPAKDRDAP